MAGAVGLWGLSAYPFVADNAFLGLIEDDARRHDAVVELRQQRELTGAR